MNVKTFLENIRTVVKANKQATAGNLVMLLNPKIRGWANYHRHVVSKAIFNRVDDAIFSLLWWWCKRRHPGKSRQWVRSKYFTTVGGNNWVFFGELKRMNGEQWCKRRHPNKSRRWVKEKCFTTVGGDNWVFRGELKMGRKESRPVTLPRAANVPIVRHVLIRLDANPYDLRYRAYFAARNAPGGKVRSAKGSTADIARRIDPTLPQARVWP